MFLQIKNSPPQKKKALLTFSLLIAFLSKVHKSFLALTQISSHLQFLVSRADDLVSMMTSKLTRKSFDFNRSICHQYDYIVNRITSSSKNTDELVDLEKYIDNLRSGPLIHLKVEVNLLLLFVAVKLQRFLYITCISEINLYTDVCQIIE